MDENKDFENIEEANILDETEFQEEIEPEVNSIEKEVLEPIESLEPVETESIEENEISQPDDMITVRPIKFKQFEATAPVCTIKKNLDILQDISMHVSVELGRTKSSIKDVMEMEQGSIVELDKVAGEQVEIFVNEKLVAKGEVIVIEDKFGVRVTSTSFPKDIT